MTAKAKHTRPSHKIAIDDGYLMLKDEDGETCEGRNVRNPQDAKQAADAWARKYPLDREQVERELQTFQKEDELFAAIARRALGIETLETRNSDRLDFHEVSVWSVRKALLQAYLAGRGEATR